MELLLEWWEYTNDQEFADSILKLGTNPVGGFSAWLDGDTLIELAAKLPDENYYQPLPNLSQVLNAIEDAISDILDWHPTYDEIESLADKVDEYESRLSERVLNAVSSAMTYHISNISDAIADADSESSLEEQIEAVKKFAARAKVSADSVENAIKVIREKIKDISEREIEEGTSPEIESTHVASDTFDNAAIRNLFAPLISSK